MSAARILLSIRTHLSLADQHLTPQESCSVVKMTTFAHDVLNGDVKVRNDDPAAMAQIVGSIVNSIHGVLDDPSSEATFHLGAAFGLCRILADQ